MNIFVLEDVFISALKLDSKSRDRVLEFILMFKSNPAHPSISFERISNKSNKVWSGRITDDLRAIVFKDGDLSAIVYVDRHDAAYDWAKRRNIGYHKVTGSFQIVKLVESVKEVLVRKYVDEPIFQSYQNDYLVSLGLPESWLPWVKELRSLEPLFDLGNALPDDIIERLFDLGNGELVTPPVPVSSHTNPVATVATQRRFYVVDDIEGLRTALEAPMHRWIAFLHPSQKSLIEKDFTGPSKVSGAAGTGKTVVAMHRARFLARKGERVLLTSYIKTLCENLKGNIDLLCSPKEQTKITISTFHKQALSIVRQNYPDLKIVKSNTIFEHIDSLQSKYAPQYEKRFLCAEWENVIGAQSIETWDEYRDASRTGRGTGLGVKERKRLWRLFSKVFQMLESSQSRDWPGICRLAENLLREGKVKSPFTAVIVDEVQDLSVSALRFLHALSYGHRNNLMLCGDAGQSIYPGATTLSSMGIEVRGRASILRINYRTTEEIRKVADKMLGTFSDDMDGGTEDRKSRSLLRGPSPRFIATNSRSEEIESAVKEISRWLGSGLRMNSIGVFARTQKAIQRLSKALDENNIAWRFLSDKETSQENSINIGTMHSAKGLEFKAVLVLGCSDKELPNGYILKAFSDPQDLENARQREKRLLYVAMTRARDELTLTWAGEASPFLLDIVNNDTKKDLQ